jgi:hypothetical protein
MVNYRGNFNPTFSRVEMMQYITAILGQVVLYNIGYTNTMAIYCHSTVITKAMLLYYTEGWCDHGMAVNYCGNKFYNIGSLPALHDLSDHTGNPILLIRQIEALF